MPHRDNILTVTLNPAVDQIITFKNLKENFSWSAGGKGINVSRSLKIFGIRSCATGFLGGWTGEIIKEKLDQENIPHDFEMIAGCSRVNSTVLDTVQRKNRSTRVLEQGPRVQPQEWKRFQQRFKKLLKGSSYVVLSGSPTRGLSSRVYSELIKSAQRMKTKVVLDTSGAALKKALQVKPDILKLNSEEAQEVCGHRLDSLGSLKKAVKKFVEQGIPLVMVTMGRQGAVLSTSSATWRALPPLIHPVNTLGCGDSFLAGFLCAHRRGENMPDSLRLATAAGAANALTLSPGTFKRDILLKLIKRIRIEKV